MDCHSSTCSEGIFCTSRAESEGLRFNSSWGQQFSPTHVLKLVPALFDNTGLALAPFFKAPTKLLRFRLKT